MILVTGADGLIGGLLLRDLRERGFAAEGSSRSAGRQGLLSLDLRGPAQADLPGNITTAVLCAWSGGVAECAADPGGTRAVNVDGNLALIARLQHSGARVIFVSTSLVFAGRDTGPYSALLPCCEYARQKAAVEQAADVVVRLTKVGETLLPRLRAWAGDLRLKTPVHAADWLRCAPVPAAGVVAGLSWLASNQAAGVFQMSALRDHTYFEMASALAERLGSSVGRVHRDTEPSPFFDIVPSRGTLQPAAPEGCPDWPEGGDLVQILVEQAIS